MVAFLFASFAFAQSSWTPADVTVQIDDGVSVNWTRGVLIAEVLPEKTLIGTKQAVNYKSMEQEARMRVGELIKRGWDMVPLTSEMSLKSLNRDSAVQLPTKGMRNNWRVVETNYRPNGDVSLVAEWKLSDTLLAWTNRDGSVTNPQLLRTESPVTGLLIDARDCGFTPVYAPSIVSHSGEVLFDGLIYTDEALRRMPVTYVSTPIHPATQNAGTAPEIIVPRECSDGIVVLSKTEDIGYETLHRVLSGALVIVVDE